MARPVGSTQHVGGRSLRNTRNTEQIERRDILLIANYELLIGAGIFANLAFEEIGRDLYVVALLAFLAVYLLRRRGLQPSLIYQAVEQASRTLDLSAGGQFLRCTDPVRIALERLSSV